MRRPLAHITEVVRGGDDTCAEMKLPQPIGQHARRQRIVGSYEPFGKGSASFPLGCIGRERISLGDLCERAQTRRDNFCAFSLRIATFENTLLLARLLGVSDTSKWFALLGRHRAHWIRLAVIPTGQGRVEAVVVALRDRIEFVIVTPRAADR